MLYILMPSTQVSFYFEDLTKKYRFSGKLVPIYPQFSAGCGYMFKSDESKDKFYKFLSSLNMNEYVNIKDIKYSIVGEEINYSSKFDYNTELIPAYKIAVVGAGGKTTSVFKSRFLLNKIYNINFNNFKFLYFTTTKMQLLEHTFNIHDAIAQLNNKKETLFASEVSIEGKKKLSFPDVKKLNGLDVLSDISVYEADGSKCLPFKVPSEKEPVILNYTNEIWLIIGLNALSNNIKDIFRFELAKDILIKNKEIFNQLDGYKIDNDLIENYKLNLDSKLFSFLIFFGYLLNEKLKNYFLNDKLKIILSHADDYFSFNKKGNDIEDILKYMIELCKIKKISHKKLEVYLGDLLNGLVRKVL